MGIDLTTWRARIGLNYYHQCRYACRPLPVQWRAARWGVREVVNINSTPVVLQGCMAVVSLSLMLEYAFRRWGGCAEGRGGCGKVRCPKMGSGSVPSAEAGGMEGVGSGVCLLLRVCAVVLSLLLMAGDVERNPGPTDKEGTHPDSMTSLVHLLSCCIYGFIAKNPVIVGLVMPMAMNTINSHRVQ